jgi:hypothetical protein
MQAASGPSLSAVIDAVPKFISVDDFTTFRAEWTLQDGNVIVHFFTPSVAPTIAYWTEVFPVALDRVGREHFEADKPRLQAKYTVELNSWWLRALKYDHIIDIVRFMDAFFDKLDAALEA